MRTLLRNMVTGCYFQGIADWTKELSKAFDFGSPERVVRFVVAAGLNPKGMEIILGFDDHRYNIALPVDGRYGVRGVKQETSTKLDSRWPIPAALSSQAAAERERHCVSLEGQPVVSRTTLLPG